MFSLISDTCPGALLERTRCAQYTSFPLARMAATHSDTIEAWNLRTEPLPNPTGNVLERRHFKPGDIVQILVIELVLYAVDGGLQVRKAHDPAEWRVRLATHCDFDGKRVAVQIRIGRYPVRGLECELLKYL
jgi:hypothetical protein